MVAEILGLCTDNNAREQVVVPTDRRISGERNIILQARSPTDAHIWTNNTVVADANFFVEFRPRINDGGMGYDRGHTNQLSRINLMNAILLGKLTGRADNLGGP